MPRPDQGHEPSIALQSLQAMVEQQRLRISRLQQFADDKGHEWLASLYMSIGSLDAAYEAAETYGRAWFTNCVYSTELKREIAKALAVAVAEYPTVDTSFWNKIAAGEE